MEKGMKTADAGPLSGPGSSGICPKKNKTGSKGSPEIPYLAVVHRLDRPVAGVMVYARTPQAAAGLSRQFSQGSPHKVYEAVLCGRLDQKEGILEDHLVRVQGRNMSRIAPPGEKGAKKARLSYRVLKPGESGVFRLEEGESSGNIFLGSERIAHWTGASGNDFERVRIQLESGRHHQIRVQMAARGAPVAGDLIYGNGQTGARICFSKDMIALCAVSLSFRHPVSGKQMTFSFM